MNISRLLGRGLLRPDESVKQCVWNRQYNPTTRVDYDDWEYDISYAEDLQQSLPFMLRANPAHTVVVRRHGIFLSVYPQEEVVLYVAVRDKDATITLIHKLLADGDVFAQENSFLARSTFNPLWRTLE